MNVIDKKKISIVIPCFNEAEGINQLTSKLKELEKNMSESHEFIFVDDGSSDSTYSDLNQIYKDRINNDVKIIKHAKNRNVGAAIKTGISNSNSDYVAVIDSDCSYEPEILVGMLDVIQSKGADIITASPYHPKGSTLCIPYYRLFLSRNLSNLYSIILRKRLYTFTSMFRIYRREVIDNLDYKSNGFIAMAEILIKAYKKGFRILEYPATLKCRRFGISNAKILNLIKEHLYLIVKLLMKKEK